MESTAFLKDKEINILLFNHADIGISQYNYALGTGLFDFISFPKKEVEWIFNWLCQLFQNLDQVSDDEYYEHIRRILQSVIQYCPNLYFYCLTYIEFYKNYKSNAGRAINDLLNFADDIDKVIEANKDMRFKLMMEQIIYLCDDKQNLDRNFAVIGQDIGSLLTEDIMIKKKKYKNDIAEIISIKTEGMSLEECLYNIEVKKEEYEYYGRPKHVDYMPYPTPPFINGQHDYSESKIQPMHRITNASDLLYLEFISMIQEDITINRCKFCKRYFTPLRRKDAKYCENVDNELGKPCNKVAPRVLYDQRKAENPITQVYTKAYHRMMSRFRKGKLNQQELYDWQTKAANKRDACKKGEMSLEELTTWLKSNEIM